MITPIWPVAMAIAAALRFGRLAALIMLMVRIVQAVGR